MEKGTFNWNKRFREDFLEDMGSELTPQDTLGRAAIQAKEGLAQKCWEQDFMWLNIWVLASRPRNLRPDGWATARLEDSRF